MSGDGETTGCGKELPTTGPTACGHTSPQVITTVPTPTVPMLYAVAVG
jgi:hypothetical protein